MIVAPICDRSLRAPKTNAAKARPDRKTFLQPVAPSTGFFDGVFLLVPKWLTGEEEAMDEHIPSAAGQDLVDRGETDSTDINILIIFGPTKDPKAQHHCSNVAKRDCITTDEAYVREVHAFLNGMIHEVNNGVTDMDFLFSQCAGVSVSVFAAAPTMTYRGGVVLPSLWIDAIRVFDDNGHTATHVVCDDAVLSIVAGHLAETIDAEWVRHAVMSSNRGPNRSKTSCTDSQDSGCSGQEDEVEVQDGLDNALADQLWETGARHAVMTIEIPKAGETEVAGRENEGDPD